MILELEAKNFGCLHEVTVRFARLHALIGPNDSGKSTILRALRTIAQLARGRFSLQTEKWSPFDAGLDSVGSPLRLRVTTDLGTYACERKKAVTALGTNGFPIVEETATAGLETRGEGRDLLSDSNVLLSSSTDWAHGIRAELSGVHYFAFSEEGLRQPSGFMPKHQTFLSERGEGLPGLYFALRNDREEAFERILKDLRALFPTVKTVRAQPRSTTELEIEVELTDGTRVRAAHISTGLLYYLAFAALPEFFGPVSTILLEEPENGLHPARIAQVVAVLRALSETKQTQIIMTTQSPLVVNELKPEEVSVVTRPSLEAGTRVTPIAETANFEKRSGVYALGELWLSYADGNIEQALFDATAR